MPEVMQWAADHPTELTLLLLSHCFTGTTSTGCDAAFSKPFTDLGIHVITSSQELLNMTVSEAEEFAALSNGGKLLATFADDSFVDSTYGDAGGVVTYGPFGSGQPKLPNWNFDALWGYTDKVLGEAHNRPWMAQGIWQETADVIESYLGNRGVFFLAVHNEHLRDVWRIFIQQDGVVFFSIRARTRVSTFTAAAVLLTVMLMYRAHVHGPCSHQPRPINSVLRYVGPKAS